MTIQHLYFAIEKPDGFTARQWLDAVQAVIGDLQRWREADYVMPSDMLHYAVRLDGNEILVDGLVETDRLTPSMVADTMATAAGVPTQDRGALRTEMITKRRRLDTREAALTYRAQNREAWDGSL